MTTTQPLEVEATPVIDRQITEALATFSPTDAGIAELAAKAAGLQIEGVEDREGYRAVSTVRKEVKAVRVQVEHRRKALKADALKYGRAVDGEAKRITAALLEIEEPLHDQEKLIDEQRVAIKAKEEAAKRAYLDKRMASLQAVGADVPVSTVESWDDDTFAEMLAEYTERFQAAEAARLAAEAEEKARQEAEAAEREAERARMEAERKALDAERAAAQAERDKLEAERRELEQAKAVEAAKAQAVAEERERAEREKREAELKAEREAELAAKREAARPDAQRIRGIALDLAEYELPQASWTAQARSILSAAEQQLDALADSLDGGAA